MIVIGNKTNSMWASPIELILAEKEMLELDVKAGDNVKFAQTIAKVN